MAKSEATHSSASRQSELSLPLTAAIRRYFAKRVPYHEVDDCVQDVVLSIQARRNTSEIEDVERYVFVVAANLLRRRWKHGNSRLVPIPDNWDIPSTITPERLLIGRELLLQAREAIGNLPTKTRQIFILHRFEGMTYREIGKEFDISVSAVEKHIITALRAIKHALEAEG